MAIKRLIGSSPSQVSRNKDLGSMAFQSKESVSIGILSLEELRNNPTISGGTANGVAYLNGSKVLTTGSGLTFDGTSKVTIGSGAAGYVMTSSGECLIGQDGSGLYINYGFGVNPSVPFYIGNGATTAQNYTVAPAGAYKWNINGEQMRLTSTGLGIGTSSPGAKLQIGTGSATGLVDNVFLGGNSTNTAQFRWVWNHPGAGYLGIGTANDTYGAMIFGQASGVTGAVATEWMRLDSSGNLGLGVTPSGWRSNHSVIQLGGGTGLSLASGTGSGYGLFQNTYFDASNAKYVNTGYASNYYQYAGTHVWNTAPSGTAGNAISFTQAMTLDASGNLNINSGGNSGPYFRFQNTGGNSGARVAASLNHISGANLNYPFITANITAVYDNFYDIRFFTDNGTSSAQERMRIDSSGNVGIGTSSPVVGCKLTVASAGESALGIQDTDQANTWLILGHNNGASTYVSRNGSGFGQHVWYGHDGSSFQERMRIDSSGNVGIGTNSPGAMLDVVGNIYCRSNVLADVFGGYSGGNTTLTTNTTGTAALIFKTFQTERMRIDSSGNVGIGTSSPTNAKLQVSGGAIRGNFGWDNTTYYNNSYYHHSSSYGGFAFGTGTGKTSLFSINASGTMYEYINLYNDGNTLALYTANTERMRIDSSGNLLVGTTSTASGVTGIAIQGNNRVFAPYTTATASAGTCMHGRRDTTGNFIQFTYNGWESIVGTVSTNGSSVAYNTSSDYRLKENIQPMQNALATVAQLNPVTYTWKADGSDGQGFIAHELQAVVPDCVTGEKDAVDEEGNPVYQGIDTSFLVATLCKAIQELEARVKQLEGK